MVLMSCVEQPRLHRLQTSQIPVMRCLLLVGVCIAPDRTCSIARKHWLSKLLRSASIRRTCDGNASQS